MRDFKMIYLILRMLVLNFNKKMLMSKWNNLKKMKYQFAEEEIELMMKLVKLKEIIMHKQVKKI